MVWIRNEKINFFFFLFCNNLYAANILDYEIEIFIKEIISEIKLINNYKNNINFKIVLDENPNAFVNENNTIFISTGILKYSDSYEAVIGILAHEIGHIQLHHIAKRKDSINKLKNLNKLSNLSIIAGSLIAKNSTYLIESMITNQVGIQNYFLSFSRDQEREADYYGITTLNKLNLSNEPLIKFLNLLEKKSIQQGLTDEHSKFSTHPIYKERYDLINNMSEKKNYNFNEKVNENFNFIKAKLFGFTENEKHKIREYLSGDFANYAESIILSKKGRLKESIKLFNKVLKKRNEHMFLLETKADILYSNSYIFEALSFYKEVIKKYPLNHYVNKRIFDIEFSQTSNKNKKFKKELYDKFSFLLEIFFYDKELKMKFINLAKKNKYENWLDYFFLEDKYYKKDLDRKKFEININKIIEKTKDKSLLKLIDKHKKILYENK